MGIYGIDVFSQTRFGRDPDLVRPDFAVDPFVATPLDYSTLHLTWSKPNSTDCEYLRLVRNTANLPQDQNDGYQVFNPASPLPPTAPTSGFGDPNDSLPTGAITQYTDMNLGGGFQYYSMFGWGETEQAWIRCTDLIALVPLNWGYGNRFYTLLPMVYRDQDILLVDPYNPWPVESPLPPLQRYLSLLGFQMDFIRTELESLTSVNDALNCSGALLPLLAQELGLPNEPEIGMQQERLLIQNAIHLYKLKGSPLGISEFVSILTGYPMAILTHHGYNDLLTRDDSIGEDAIGTWQEWPPASTHFTPPGGETGVFLNQIPDLLTVPTTNPLENYPGFEPGPYPIYNNTGMQIQANGSGDLWITTGAVPITDFMSSTYGPGHVTFQISIWSTATRTVKLSVWGDVGDGTPVSIIPETSFTENSGPLGPGHWTVMTATAEINPYPSGVDNAADFYWIYPVIHIVGANDGESHYMTLMGLWPCTPGDIGINTPEYDYPRDVKVIVSPTAANLLSNPLTSFLHGFDGITAAVDPLQPSVDFSCDLSIRYASPFDPPPEVVNGIGSLQVSATSPGATVWFGLVDVFGPDVPPPKGWFSDPSNDWFPNEVLVSPTRMWFDAVEGWFFMNNDYFSIGTPAYAGDWFPPAQQPPQNGNLLPFTLEPGQDQPFNFSVYADYLTVMDPSNAVMQLGIRWYYPDGTYVETNPPVQNPLTKTLTRYSAPPPDPTQYFLAYPPPEAVTGTMPIEFFPFVRFPYAQQSLFLLNSAMLSPGPELIPYFDISMFPGDPDYIEDSHGATFYFENRDARFGRLEEQLYRWIPMGASHSLDIGAGGDVLPLDPTEWFQSGARMVAMTTMTVTATNSTHATVTLAAITGLTATAT